MATIKRVVYGTPNQHLEVNPNAAKVETESSEISGYVGNTPVPVGKPDKELTELLKQQVPDVKEGEVKLEEKKEKAKPEGRKREEIPVIKKAEEHKPEEEK